MEPRVFGRYLGDRMKPLIFQNRRVACMVKLIGEINVAASLINAGIERVNVVQFWVVAP